MVKEKDKIHKMLSQGSRGRSILQLLLYDYGAERNKQK